MRNIWATLAVAMILTACQRAEPPVLFALPANDLVPSAGPVTVYPEAQRARFDVFPDPLLRAAVAACVNPGQTLRRAEADVVVCESLPSPEGAAAIILAHNGTVTDIPRLFTTLVVAAEGEGYLVTGDTYIAVPQRTGGVVQIRLPESDAGIRDLLQRAGGVLVDEAAG